MPGEDDEDIEPRNKKAVKSKVIRVDMVSPGVPWGQAVENIPPELCIVRQRFRYELLTWVKSASVA